MALAGVLSQQNSDPMGDTLLDDVRALTGEFNAVDVADDLAHIVDEGFDVRLLEGGALVDLLAPKTEIDEVSILAISNPDGIVGEGEDVDPETHIPINQSKKERVKMPNVN